VPAVGSSGEGLDGDRAEPTATGRRLRISTRSGRIEVIAEERADVLIEKAGRTVTPEVDESDRLTITARSSPVVARVPLGTDVVVGSVSGRVELKGRLGACGVTTVSGRVEVDAVESFEGRSAAGRLKVGSCSGRLRVDTGTGRVSIGSCGDLAVSAVSARVEVDEATGSVQVRTVSGRILVGSTALVPRVRAETISGRVTIDLLATVAPVQRFASKSGSIRSEVPDAGDLDRGSVDARTISGSIRVRVRGD
jgi:DUF4097 and DUF4098 domain-containing protein YvlB